jgi:hypothetical protein
MIGLIFVSALHIYLIMKRTYLILGFAFCLVLIIFSCERVEVLPPNQAKGKIILVTGLCYGEAVIIEVENPKGIGLAGTFSTPGRESEAISYDNAIAIPYFSKIGLPDSIPQIIDTQLYFEFRELATEDSENPYLFSTNQAIICLGNMIPPQAKPLIITKIISYK